MENLIDHPISSPEGSNFDNDFEKVEPPAGAIDDSVSSSTGQDFFTPAPAAKPAPASSEAATAPLLSFDDPPAPPKVAEPTPKPDSSTVAKESKPEVAPAPAEPPKKAAVSTGRFFW